MRTKMIATETRIDRVSGGIEYSTEFQVWERVNWFIKLEPYVTSWGWHKRGGICGTAYDTKEQAQAAIKDAAIVWGHDDEHCEVFSRVGTEFVTKKHRKKVRV